MHLVTMVTMGPVCLMKLTKKRKLLRTLGFFLDFDLDLDLDLNLDLDQDLDLDLGVDLELDNNQ